MTKNFKKSIDWKKDSGHSKKIYDKKEKRVSCCHIAGVGLLLLSVLSLLLPFNEAHPWDASSWGLPLKFHLFFLWLGLPLFLYGWLWSRKILAVERKFELFGLARLLKQAELDKKLTVTTELDVFGGLIFHVYDKKEGPEQRLWVRRIEVTERGDFYCRFGDSGIKWRSKHGRGTEDLS